LRKLDKERSIKTLDKIEALTSIPGRDSNAYDIGLPGIDGLTLDLMVKVARRKGGVKLLVERYAASRSQIVVGAISGVLTRRAESVKLKDAYLLFEFIEKLQRKNHSSVLVTILTAVKFQIGLAKVWQYTRMPNSFYPFLQHCLNFTGVQANEIPRTLSDEVQLSAIDVLETMCKAKIYNLNFDESQRQWIENKVREITIVNSDNEMFQKDASYFFDCVDKGE
jgi:hypothetical protein